MIVWPLRLRPMPLPRTTSPSPVGQNRSLSTVVLAVITCPQVTVVAAAGVAVTTSPTSRAIPDAPTIMRRRVFKVSDLPLGAGYHPRGGPRLAHPTFREHYFSISRDCFYDQQESVGGTGVGGRTSGRCSVVRTQRAKPPIPPRCRRVDWSGSIG